MRKIGLNFAFSVSLNMYANVNESTHDAGFRNGALKACCGGGGQYNYNTSAMCGYMGSKACEDPSTYVNWDGIHLTEAAYRYIASGLINGPYSYPALSSSSIQGLISFSHSRDQ